MATHLFHELVAKTKVEVVSIVWFLLIANVNFLSSPALCFNKQVLSSFSSSSSRHLIAFHVNTMRLSQLLLAKPSGSLLYIRKWPCKALLGNRVVQFWKPTVRFPAVWKTFGSMPSNTSIPITATPEIRSDVVQIQETSGKWQQLEENVEKVIYGCRFLTFLAVLGSLVGSLLCFVKGCTYVYASFVDYFVNHGKVVVTLVEAIDVYLLGTVMMVFGMGLYELFVSNLDIATTDSNRSNLFGLFPLKERPKWLEIKSLNELKTKLGHVIVMVLLVGLLEKSRKADISTTGDLLCFSASILLSSVSLYLLSRLKK